METTTYGPDALRLRFADAADEAAFRRGRALVAQLERNPFPALREVVPAFTTLLLHFLPRHLRDTASLSASASRLAQLAGEVESSQKAVIEERPVEIPVHYAGPDLARVAVNAGISAGEVIARHAASDYRVHCLGFAPGFPYLGGLDPRLHTPRLDAPRPRVPAGSVAIGGEHTGIYSIASPGGWNLIGRTDFTLFNPAAETLAAMFPLRPGNRVRFLAQANPGEAPLEAPPPPASRLSHSAPCLRVLSPGLGLTIQDFGRPGCARFGVPPGGAMDPRAAAAANRLLDNPPEAPVLELCWQGQQLEVLRDGWVAVAGAGAAAGHAPSSAFRVRAGERLSFGAGQHGLWTCLAVPGGFAAPRILGSASANPRAGIGRGLAAGDELGCGSEAVFSPPDAVASRVMAWSEIPDLARPPVLRVWPGPQWDWFAPEERDRFFVADWRISPRSDRVGFRLDGPTLAAPGRQLISEPVLPGSIQIPAGGQPIITMPDGPTLGGYPKLGLVDPADLAWLAQTRPGQRVRFIPVEA